MRNSFTYEQLYDLYWTQDKSTTEIGKMFNCTGGNILYWLRNLNIKRKETSHPGAKNGSWKGGIKNKYKTRDGHIRIRPSKEVGEVLEHRYIMEQYLGKPLTEDQVVHHINGDPTDNRIENLQVMTHAEHSKLHYSKNKKDPTNGRWIS